MYPQALHHPEYNITQLTYLKVDCPIDGDLDELCLSFFNQVDKELGTRYSRNGETLFSLNPRGRDCYPQLW